MKITYLIPIIILLFIFSNIAYADENDATIQSLTMNKTVTENGTTINVFVTTNDNLKNDGQVMISSSIIIGFVGLGSFLSASRIGHETDFQIKLFSLALILVTALIILHLIIILLAFLGDLSEIVYSIILVATMFLIGAIITCFIFLSADYFHYIFAKHDIDSIASDEIANFISEIITKPKEKPSTNKKDNNDDGPLGKM